MTLAQQKEFVRLIGQGASPAAACLILHVPVDFAFLTYENDARFRRRLETVYQSLTDNVRAALYREAMKGKVTAQTFWLKTEAQPPRRDAKSDVPATRDTMLADLTQIMSVLQSEPSQREVP